MMKIAWLIYEDDKVSEIVFTKPDSWQVAVMIVYFEVPND